MVQYKPVDLVYLISPPTSLLKTSSRKLYTVFYIGPLVVYKIMNNFQYILLAIEGKIMNGILNVNRLKQEYVITAKGPANTLADLKQIINLRIRINDKNRNL